MLHQQPFFTEGHWKRILRAPTRDPNWHYDPRDLPRTQAGSQSMLRLPSFASAEQGILDQYAAAFNKVHAGAKAILETAATKTLR